MSKENSADMKKEPNSLVSKLDQVGFATYDRVLFEDFTLNVGSGDRIALTGRSGSGKTVLMRILAGIEQPQEGSVFHLPSTNISYVPQELEDIEANGDVSIRQLFRESRGLDDIESRMRQLELKLATDPTTYEQTLQEYGELSENFQELDGYDPEPEMEKFLAGLGVDEHSTGNITLDTLLSNVSSGQLKRIMIARALYGKPDLMILDDPTSHLDVQAVEWLQNYLKRVKSAVVIASNNEEFINNFSNQTIGLTDSGRVFSFGGNYADFVTKRDAVIDSEKAQAKSVANKIEDLKETDRMFRSKNAYKRSSDMAQVGRALATRMRKLGERYDDMPGSQDVYRKERVRDLKFIPERRSGQDVVSIRKVAKGYGQYVAVDLTRSDPINISMGESWLVKGPNGAGKSTLVRMIAHKALGGDFAPDSGQISIGASVDTAYYAPDINHVLGDGLLLDEVTSLINNSDKSRAVGVLMFFGFTQAQIHNLDVRKLSSGERKRLGLARAMLRNPNLLVLDEPTGDYMSDEIKTRLAQSLEGYTGTLILISHDTDFIGRLRISRELDMSTGKVKI